MDATFSFVIMFTFPLPAMIGDVIRLGEPPRRSLLQKCPFLPPPAPPPARACSPSGRRWAPRPVHDRFGSRNIERSTDRRRRWRCGVSSNTVRKQRLKGAEEKQGDLAPCHLQRITHRGACGKT